MQGIISLNLFHQAMQILRRSRNIVTLSMSERHLAIISVSDKVLLRYQVPAYKTQVGRIVVEAETFSMIANADGLLVPDLSHIIIAARDGRLWMSPVERHQHCWKCSVPIKSSDDVELLPEEIPVCLRFSINRFEAAIKPIKAFVGTRAVDGFSGVVLNITGNQLSLIGTDGISIMRTDYPIEGNCPDLSFAVSQDALKAIWDLLLDGSELFLGLSDSHIRFSNGRADVVAARVAMTTTKPLLEICEKAMQHSTPAIEIEKSDFLNLLSHAQALGKKHPLRLVIGGSRMMTTVASDSYAQLNYLGKGLSRYPSYEERRLKEISNPHGLRCDLIVDNSLIVKALRLIPNKIVRLSTSTVSTTALTLRPVESDWPWFFLPTLAQI